MAWRRTGDKPLPETMHTQFTNAYMRQYGKISKTWYLNLVITVGDDVLTPRPSADTALTTELHRFTNPLDINHYKYIFTDNFFHKGCQFLCL